MGIEPKTTVDNRVRRRRMGCLTPHIVGQPFMGLRPVGPTPRRVAGFRQGINPCHTVFINASMNVSVGRKKIPIINQIKTSINKPHAFQHIRKRFNLLDLHDVLTLMAGPGKNLCIGTRLALNLNAKVNTHMKS